MSRKIGGIADVVQNALSALASLISANTTAIGANAGAIAALGSPLRYDAAQTLTGTQKATAYSNLGGDQSLGGAGWTKLPNGLILQWGSVSSGSGGTGTWAYPIPFPNSIYVVTAQPTDGNGASVSVLTKNKTQATYIAAGATGDTPYNSSLDFFAIGR